MGDSDIIHDMFRVEYKNEYTCYIGMQAPKSAVDMEAAIGVLCGLLHDLYEGPVKLVVFHGITTDFYACDYEYDQAKRTISPVGNQKVDLLLDLILKAPYFSVSMLSGCVEDLGADIAITSDWRIMSETSQFCFASRRGLANVRYTGRLVELIGSFKAFDLIIRRRCIFVNEAMNIGLATAKSDNEDFVEAIERHAKNAKKESISIMRHAVRSPASNDIGIERIVGSIAAAN